jgi:predicted benzoate:H+ symporter BenE
MEGVAHACIKQFITVRHEHLHLSAPFQQREAGLFPITIGFCMSLHSYVMLKQAWGRHSHRERRLIISHILVQGVCTIPKELEACSTVC